MIRLLFFSEVDSFSIADGENALMVNGKHFFNSIEELCHILHKDACIMDGFPLTSLNMPLKEEGSYGSIDDFILDNAEFFI